VAARAGRAHLAGAALRVRREDRQPPLESRALARGALRRFTAANEKLELMRTALALIFVQGHASIIAGYRVAAGGAAFCGTRNATSSPL